MAPHMSYEVDLVKLVLLIWSLGKMIWSLGKMIWSLEKARSTAYRGKHR